MPLDRTAITQIVLSQVILAFTVILLFVVLLLDAFLDLVHQSQLKALRQVIEGHEQLSDQLRQWMLDMSEATKAALDKPASPLDRIISNLKKLMP